MNRTNKDSFVCIARIYNDYKVKFGIPRQSGIVNEVESVIIFEPPYRSADSVRGLESYSCLWLLWKFSENEGHEYKPVVRPPKLGGNERVGVYATRSPFRPNPIGLSCVDITAVECSETYGPVIHVRGADLMNGTPIYDIKPYVPYTDCRTYANAGLSVSPNSKTLFVCCDENLILKVDESKREGLLKLLSLDPRPGYHHLPDRIYSFEHGEYRIRFTVDEDVLKVYDIIRTD